MKETKDLNRSFDSIRKNLQVFIELSLREEECSWLDWVSRISRKIETRCWERKNCNETKCPAYKNSCGRCWIIAGSMFPGEIHCKFVEKFKSCKDCEIYQEAVYQDPYTEVEEYLIVLVHSLRSKQQELNELATTDFLTKLFNRRYLDAYLTHEYDRILRNDTSMILVMADINGFKAINDTYGHQAGDEVLCECAAILKQASRKSELISRYGGDEFVMLLHEKDNHQQAASSLISRIEQQLARRNKNARSRPAIELSYGFAVLDRNNDISRSIKLADKNMYLDKLKRKG